MTDQRKGLDLSGLQSKPRESFKSHLIEQPPSPANRWPSREAAPREVQLNIRALEPTITRFKDFAWRNRLNQAQALELLLNLAEKPHE